MTIYNCLCLYTSGIYTKVTIYLHEYIATYHVLLYTNKIGSTVIGWKVLLYTINNEHLI